MSAGGTYFSVIYNGQPYWVSPLALTVAPPIAAPVSTNIPTLVATPPSSAVGETPPRYTPGIHYIPRH